MSTPLDTSLDNYKAKIDDLAKPGQPIEIAKVLEILSARDALQVELEQQKPVPINRLQQVIDLDARLRANASRITAEIDKDKGKEFVHWRESSQPSAEAWWWQLDTIDSLAPEERFDWLWKGLSIGAWAANISLAINIASRFGGAGGVGFFDPITTILLAIGALFKAGGDLPKFEKVLKKLHIPESNREITKFLATTAISGLLVSVGSAIPLASKWYNSQGLEKYTPGDLFKPEKDSDLIEAEKKFQLAISLDGHNTEAHYNLGSVYESSHEIDKAKKQYEIAIASKLPSAYNNLGRLYIQEKKYSQAADLLNKGLVQANTKHSSPEIQYSLHKNLGWARLKQGRYEEARQQSQVAIGIASSKDAEKYIPNPGAAHCLLAQALEQLKQAKALTEWKQCRQSSSTLDADEDTWLHLANQKLSKQKVRQSQNENKSKVN
jgi:tetratricopeptide (TPR) repeat protein